MDVFHDFLKIQSQNLKKEIFYILSWSSEARFFFQNSLPNDDWLNILN